MIRRTLTALGLSILATACTTQEKMPGAARATIAQVPAAVYCVQITVADANHSVQRTFDVNPNQAAILELDGLPVGFETFSGAAYAAPCSYIGGLAPSWIADPVGAYLSAGTVAPVTLHMHQTGGAVVGVEFDDGGTPFDGGEPYDGGGEPFDGGSVDFAYPLVDLAYPSPDLAH